MNPRNAAFEAAGNVISRAKRGRRRKTDSRKAVAYLRRSTNKQAISIDAQRLEIETWATRENVKVVAWFVETQSGAEALDKRVTLWEAILEAETRRVGLFVVAKRCRLARDAMYSELIGRDLTRKSIRVVAADGELDNSGPTGQLVRRILDAVAEHERAMIKARTRAAAQVRRAQGRHVAGLCPYGFTKDTDGLLVEVKPEQTVLGRIHDMRTEGSSIKGIAEALNRDGVPARGTRWHPTSVQRILSRT